MKKLIIAIATIASAVVANAAACSWSTTGTIYKPTDSTTAVAGFTAYLFDTTTVTQSALVEAIRGGASITDYTAMSTYTTGSAAKVSSTSFEHAEGSITAFFAIVQDDYVYISNEKTATAASVGSATFSFASQSASSAKVFDSTTAYSSAGWYQSVPEPTSGLLMLLGMAGLALRRRRA